MKMGRPTEVPGLFEIPGGFSLLVKAKSGSVTVWKRKKLVDATRGDALAMLERLRVEARYEADAKARGEATNKTVSVYARRYAEDLGRRVRAERITKKTAETHVANLDRFVVPVLGRLNVDDVKPKDIREWMRALEALRKPAERRGRGAKTYAQAATPYAKATLASAWRTLRAFFSWATVEADLGRNPAREARLEVDAASPKTKVTLTRAELERLLDAAARDHDRGLRVLLLVALAGATRASELSALTREDVDLAAGTVQIRRSHVEGTVGKPKTKGSRRVVHLPPELVAELRAYLAWQDEIEAKGRPLLFPTSIGTHRTPASFKEPLARLAARAGIEKHLTSHVLRRTANNLLRQAAGELVAREVTGHVTQEMTAHYSEVDHAERTAALRAAFGSALGRPAA